MRWIYEREARRSRRKNGGKRSNSTPPSSVPMPRRDCCVTSLRPRRLASDVVRPNGVDTDYFDPAQSWPSPFPAGALSIAFTGAMDYYANVDGVTWFADVVLPAVRAQFPQALFSIVGSNPTAEVRALARRPGVSVTGRVPDIRPYLSHADVVVVPLRLARGVQNKVLEAMAMGKRIVATPNALQGIQLPASGRSRRRCRRGRDGRS